MTGAISLAPASPDIFPNRALADLQTIAAPESLTLATQPTSGKGTAVLFRPPGIPSAPAQRLAQLINGLPFDIVIFAVAAD